jgi:hypothetical protein
MKKLIVATALALTVTLSTAPANALSIRLPFLGIAVHLPIVRHYYRVVRRPVYARSVPVRTRTAAPVRTRQHSTTTASNGGMSINDPK